MLCALISFKKNIKKVQVFGAANADDIYTHFLKRFFGCGPFSKVFIESVTVLVLLCVLVLCSQARGITAPRTRE